MILPLFWLLHISFICQAASPDDWKSRSIYQVLTDRFATDNSANDDTCGGDLSKYCGGTFKGLENKLDYISGMGFDAIWISPVVKQIGDGYHGYWASDLTAINDHFGSMEDLQSLVKTAHSKGIWVMLDMVVNHMGGSINDINNFVPFNDGSHYHDCNGCISDCNIHNFNDAAETEHCRLAGLPDLNQDNEYVSSKLIEVYTKLVEDSGVDGIRMDTVPEVNPSYWKTFKSQAAPNMYIIGEVFNGDSNYIDAHGSELDGLLSYPMYYTIRNVFQQKQDMSQISSRLKEYYQVFGQDSHDNARFLSQNSDQKLFTSAVVLSMMIDGIPIVYYGTAQMFSGGNDPQNREIFWNTQFNNSTELYKKIKALNAVRKEDVFDLGSPATELSVQSSFYAFSRGKVLVALTNVGEGGDTQTYTLNQHPFSSGDIVCNVFSGTSDCITVTDQGVAVVLQDGESKVFVPKSALMH
eukprot:jgi/Bigna1/85018/estExt_fgenesh1_pg.C_10614